MGGLFIRTRCGWLTETLRALQHDPNRPEDVLKVDADEDGVGGDDAAVRLFGSEPLKTPRELAAGKVQLCDKWGRYRILAFFD